jgi:NAD(P)H-dependent FMN reductase
MSTVRESNAATVTTPPRTHPVTSLPPLAKVRQQLSPDHLSDVPGAIRTGIAALGEVPRIKPGAKIAVTGGSRGIADIVPILRTVVDELKARGVPHPGDGFPRRRDRRGADRDDGGLRHD